MRAREQGLTRAIGVSIFTAAIDALERGERLVSPDFAPARD